MKQANKNLSISLFLSIFFLPNTYSFQFYSQSNQDKYLYENFFKNKRSGIFIDIGAHDGKTISNTYFFEKNLNWSGICIEPLPNIFKQLKTNRSCICLNGCISDKEGTAEFLAINTKFEHGEMLSGLIDKYDPRHLKRIEKELIALEGTSAKILVECFTLDSILELYNFKYIDYLSIDTEGGELDILKSIDFNKYIIDFISVENNYGDNAIRNFLKSKGYTYLIRLEADELYQRRKI